MPGSRRRKSNLRERSPIKVKIVKTSPRKSKYVKVEQKTDSDSDDDVEVLHPSRPSPGSNKRKGYRQNYSLKDLLNAYNMVKYENMPVQTAAKTFGVPSTTLRDRVRGNVTLESVRPGPSSLLSIDQEMTLVDHISYMAKIGCGYTRSDIFDLATDLAVHLGLIREGRQLQRSWYRRFRARWPMINAVRPTKVTRKRSPNAVALEQESIRKYFEDFRDVLDEHDLMEKPHRIFTLDESFIPQKRRDNETNEALEACVKAIGCGNAIGSALPPYLVFPDSGDPDSENNDETIVNSASPGSLIRFRETYDDWSESEIFQDYINSHFLKSAEVGETSPTDPVLILYDRSKQHINSCIDWAKNLNIILFLLPPYYGYATCSEQIGCLGHLKRTALQSSQKYLFFNGSPNVTKSELCRFISESYEKVMSAENLIALFRKTGTYPYNPDGIAKERLPSYIIMAKGSKTGKKSEVLPAAFSEQNKQSKRKDSKTSKRKTSPKKAPKTKKLKRRKQVEVSSDSLDESEMELNDMDSEGELVPFQPPSITSVQKVEVKSEHNSLETKTETEIVPTESTIILEETPQVLEDEESEEEYTCISDGKLFTLKCIVCKKYNPPKSLMQEGESVISWTQCDSCQAWSHLGCSALALPEPECPFLCPTCTKEFKLFGNSFTAANITEWINAKRAITENILSAQNG